MSSDEARESVRVARQKAGDAMDTARETARENAERAGDAITVAAGQARDRAEEAIARVKPRLRGVSHTYAFFGALVAGVVLIALAVGSSRAVAGSIIYAVALCGLFGVSALYHRVNWRRPSARTWMRRLDHTMIFVFIAATYTPMALLLLDDPLRTIVLAVVWGGALLGVVLKLLWIEAPYWVAALVYVALGWTAIAAAPELVANGGLARMLIVLFGGLLYTAGAVIYAVRRPDPAPATFGYHEIFHVLVIAAAALHYGVVTSIVAPASA